MGWVGGLVGVGCYDKLCCPASPRLLLGLDLRLGCDNEPKKRSRIPNIVWSQNAETHQNCFQILKGSKFKMYLIINMNTYSCQIFTPIKCCFNSFILHAFMPGC